MTTIAYRNRTAAADSLISEHAHTVGEMDKIFSCADGVVAMCGQLPQAKELADWVMRGQPKDEKPNLDKDVSITVALFKDDGTIWEFENSTYSYEVRAEYYALGSGRNFAIGAMAQGATAQEAVKIATDNDIYSGGAIRSIKL